MGVNSVPLIGSNPYVTRAIRQITKRGSRKFSASALPRQDGGGEKNQPIGNVVSAEHLQQTRGELSRSASDGTKACEGRSSTMTRFIPMQQKLPQRQAPEAAGKVRVTTKP